LVGKSLEAARYEILLEEEQKMIQKEKQKFKQLKESMLMQTQRMEAERVRRNEESDRRNIQQRTITVQKTWDERKELARQATKQYLAHFKRDTLDFLTDIGVLRRWSDFSFGSHFMPLFNNQILIEYYGMGRRDQEMTLLLKDSATK
jgi:exonuclease VII large subunit